MKNGITILALLLLNLILAYLFGANSFVVLTPLLIGFISYYTYYKINKPNLIYKTILIVLIMTISDLGIKQFSGGTFDQVGQFLTRLSFYSTSGIVFIVLISNLVLNTNKDLNINEKMYSVLSFLILITIEIYFFDNIGPGWKYYNWN